MPVRVPRSSLLVALCLAMAALGVPAAASTGPGVRLSADGGERVLVLEVPAAEWRTAPDGRVFPVIAGFGRLGVSGRPDVPARRERVATEPGVPLEIAAVDVVWAEGRIPGPLAAWPAEDPHRAPLSDEAPGGAFPSEVARVAVADGVFRTLHFVEIEIAPLQVDPAAGAFRVARRITVRLRPAPATARAARAPGRASGRDDLTERLGPALVHGAAEVGRARPAAAPAAMAATAATAAPTYPAFELDVTRDGLHRVTYGWAQANAPALAAFLAANPPGRYRMTVQGVDVPIRVTTRTAGVFGTDPADAIVFYGQSVRDEALFAPPPDTWQGGKLAPANVYRLTIADGAPPLAEVPGAGLPSGGYSVPASFRTTVRHESDAQFLGFVPFSGMDHWYAAPWLQAGCVAASACGDPLAASACGNRCGGGETCCAGSVTQAIDTPAHAGGPVSFRIRMLGFRYTDNDHRSEAWFDGVLRDTADWSGYVEFTQGVDQGARSFTPAVPLGAQTQVRVRLPLGAGRATRDTVGLNFVELDYDRAYRAAGGTLAFTVPNDAGHEVRIDALADAQEIWELSETVTSAAGMAIAQPRAVAAWSVNAGQARFDVARRDLLPATRRFVAAGPAGFLAPGAVREARAPSALDPGIPGSLRDFAGADWLVIGDRALLDTSAGGPLMDLVDLRRDPSRLGLSTAIIDVRNVYAEFGGGLEHPQAIKDFLAHALAHWATPPSYVLLVGDATRDYRNAYAWNPRRQFLPTMMRDLPDNAQLGYYPSDTWFTAQGGTALPSIFVGRVFAHTAAEANEAFRKIVAHETAPHPGTGWAGKTLLVSERAADRADFIGEHDTIAGRYFSGGPQIAQKVYEQVENEDCDAARPMNRRLTDAVNGGAAFLSFVGHGGYREWGDGCSFFETDGTGPDDLDAVSNANALSFQLNAACITGHFAQDTAPGTPIDPWYTLAESWQLRGNKGAVGGIYPGHLAYSFQLDSILGPVFGAMWGKRKERTAGVIDLFMRENLSAMNAIAAVESYVLAGDPALQLALPAPRPTTVTAIESAGSGALTIRWASTGAPRYRVYRSVDPAAGYVRATETTATSFTDTGLANCRRYYYYVVAVDADGFESRWSNFNETCFGDGSDCRSGVPQNPAAPAPVTLLEVKDTPELDGQLLVTWQLGAETDLLTYTVRWGTSPGSYTGEKTVVALPRSGSVTTQSTRIDGLTPKMRYYVAVRAANCSRSGTTGNELSAVPHHVQGTNPPAAVSNLRVSKVPATSDLRLSWTNPAESVWGTATSLSAIEVYADTTGPVFPLDAARRRASLAPGATSWTHAGAAAGSGRWYYTVVALDTAGLRSAGGDELPNGIDTFRVRRVGSQVQFTWDPLASDVNGQPLSIRHYNLYGRASLLKRAECSAANRLAAGIAGTNHATALPAGPFFTWQLLGEDWHGSESVW